MKISLGGIALLLTASFAVAQIPTSGLVASYLFAGDASDTGPNLLHATVLNGAALTTDRFGLAASAYVFDGINDYLQIADHSLLSVTTTGAISISAWMRADALTFPNDEGSGFVHWLGKGTPGQNEYSFRMYGLDNTDIPSRENRTSFYMFNPGPGEGAGSHVQEPVSVGEWIHYAATVDMSANQIRFYKNGVLKDTDVFLTGTFAVPPTNGTAPLRIGTRAAADAITTSYFQGAIDDVVIYDRVLDATEVQQLHSVPEPGAAALLALGIPIALRRTGRRCRTSREG